MGKFKIPEDPPTVNKTTRFPSDVVDDVENALKGKVCTFSAFVIAAARAALEDLEKQQCNGRLILHTGTAGISSHFPRSPLDKPPVNML